MPRGGKRPGAGRPEGAKGKATQERELQARLEAERLAELERQAAGAKDEVAKAALSGRKLMKEIAFDFASKFASLSAFYQPYPGWHPRVNEAGEIAKDGRGRPVMDNDNPNYNEAKFKEYGILAKDTAIGAARYQSPAYSAVVIGASVVTKVEVVGGMPDDFVAPVAPGQVIDLKPGTIITAEDEPPALPKAVGE